MDSQVAMFSDAELALQSQQGSLPAFEQLVFRYEKWVYRFVAHSCANGMDPVEITQETFVKAFQTIAQFNPRYTFAAWLFTIARRKCIDHFRARRAIAHQPLPETMDDNDPASLLASREERDALWTLARRLLPEVQFQALWLRYAEDMAVAETATVLRRTQTHVKVLLFRARQRLARELPGSAGILPASFKQGVGATTKNAQCSITNAQSPQRMASSPQRLWQGHATSSVIPRASAITHHPSAL